MRGGHHCLAEQARREYVVPPLHNAAKLIANWCGMKTLCGVSTHLKVDARDA
jgi:hypothetical protein